MGCSASRPICHLPDSRQTTQRIHGEEFYNDELDAYCDHRTSIDRERKIRVGAGSFAR